MRTTRLAAAFAIATTLATGLLLAEDQRRVAVAVKDDELGKALRDAVIAAGGRPVDGVKPAEASDLVSDRAAASKRALALASDGTAELLLVATLDETEKRETETGAVAQASVEIVVVSGRSGEVLLDVTRKSKGSAGDVERALGKARAAATADALAGFKAEIGRVLHSRDDLSVRVEVLAFGAEDRGAHGDAIDGAVAAAGIAIGSKRLDVARNAYVIEGSAHEASPDDLERALRKAFAAAGLGAYLKLSETPPGALVYAFHDPSRTVEVRVEGVNVETQQVVGADLARALLELEGVSHCERSYDGPSASLVLAIRTSARLCDLDAAIAGKPAGPLAALRLLQLSPETLRYRFVGSIEPLTIELLGIAEADMPAFGPRIDEVTRALPRVTDVERTDDVRAAAVRVKLRYQGKRNELENAFVLALAKAGFASVVAAAPRTGVDIAYRLPGKVRTVLRLEHLVASAQLTAGQRFVTAVEAIEGVKLVDRRYDAATETLELTVESLLGPSEIESRIWKTAAAAPELKCLGPGESDPDHAGFVLLSEAPADFASTVVLLGLPGEAYATDGLKFVQAVKTLAGTSGVEASYARDTRELAIKLRYRRPAAELEDALWAALSKETFSRSLAPDRRIGSLVRVVFLERKGDRSRLFVRLEGAKGDAERAAAERFLGWLKVLEGVSEVEVHPGATIEVSLWSTRAPAAFYDSVALGLATNPALAALAEGGLEGNVVVVKARPAAAPAVPAPPPAPGPGKAPGKEPGRLADVVAKLDPGVVVVTGRTPAGGWLGTGFFVSPRGYIMTNHHVAGAPRGFRQADVHLQVKTADGRVYDASYVDGNEGLDLALLKIPGDGFPALAMGDSDAVRIGDPLIVIGNPLGLEHSVCTGIVSGLDRDKGRIQTTALTNHGNSGGPVFDESGRVVAVVVAGAIDPQAMRGGVEIPRPGVNFLIPINHAIPLLQVGGAAPPEAKGGK
jgi:S1-C subfamily serine protease